MEGRILTKEKRSRKERMFPNLEKELKNKKMTVPALAAYLNISTHSAYNKLSGKTAFTYFECQKIISGIFEDKFTWDYIFYTSTPYHPADISLVEETVNETTYC